MRSWDNFLEMPLSAITMMNPNLEAKKEHSHSFGLLASVFSGRDFEVTGFGDIWDDLPFTSQG